MYKEPEEDEKQMNYFLLNHLFILINMFKYFIIN